MLASSRKPSAAVDPKRRPGRRRQLPLQGSLLGENRLQSLPCKGRWMRRKAQTEGCIAALPHGYPANSGRALLRVRRGRCVHRPASLLQLPTHRESRPPKASPARGCGVERRLRRRKRDAAGAAVAEHKRASAHAARCGHRKPDGGCAARRRQRGALPPCPTGILQTPAVPCPASVGDDACIVPETLRCRKPQAARRQLPLQGSLLGENRLQSLPCKGRWMRRKAQTEGCIAALTHRYPANPGRALPRVRRGRCSHRPANPAMPQTPGGGRKRPPYKAPASG